MSQLRYCCDDMAHAFDRGTDSEGYGPVAWDSLTVNGFCIFFGCHTTAIKVCPWCGEAVVDSVTEEE